MILKLALRNVLRQRRRTVFTMLTMFAGFFLSSLSIGWQEGAYLDVIDMFTRSRTGHVQIHTGEYVENPALYETIYDYELVAGKVEAVRGVESWTARLYAAALVQVGEQSSGVRVVGFDPARETRATGFESMLSDGRMLSDSARGEVLVGDGLAAFLDAAVGEDMILLSQAADGSIANERCTIAGIVDTGDPQTDRASCYMHLDDAQYVFMLEGRVHEIAVIAASLGRVRDLAGRIGEALADDELLVEPWQEFASEFYHAMQADLQGMWIMVAVIMVVVAVGVLNTVLMSVLERQREYGVLRALGTRPVCIVRLVLAEIAIMALLSVLLALPASLLGLHLLHEIGLRLPQAMEYGGIQFTHVRAMITPSSVYIPSITVVATAILVGLLPAMRAARTRPASAMRMH
ncbi:ABC transporter permease [Candidatus Fermentibacterales bacterium]|nr:ABC transporter permease [Candidatus Fermentibacterales bacterium]